MNNTLEKSNAVPCISMYRNHDDLWPHQEMYYLKKMHKSNSIFISPGLLHLIYWAITMNFKTKYMLQIAFLNSDLKYITSNSHAQNTENNFYVFNGILLEFTDFPRL